MTGAGWPETGLCWALAAAAKGEASEAGLGPALAGEASPLDEAGDVAVESELGFLECRARRAASWRRAREGARLSGGGMCGAPFGLSVEGVEESGVGASVVEGEEASAVFGGCEELGSSLEGPGGEKTESAPREGA